jgi:hypothetical protein
MSSRFQRFLLPGAFKAVVIGGAMRLAGESSEFFLPSGP